MATKEPCSKCRKNGRDRAGNNFTNYGEGLGGYCFSCGYSVLSDARKEELGVGNYEYNDEEVMTKEIITPEQLQEIKGYTGTKGQGQRGITDETYKAYACRFKYDEETGDVVEVFYPYTQGYIAAGYKVRKTPVKDFYTVGKIGKDSELFAQWKWRDSRGKYVLLCAGELDAMSAFQMLENYRKGRDSDFEAIPVVSSAIGETGSYKQVQLQYKWLDQFERIIVCYDSDDAGRAAVDTLFNALPKGKMFVARLPLKDVNEMLVRGKDKQFLRAFYDAAPYTPAGIVAAGSIYDEIVERSKVEKLPFPPALNKINKMLAGGINYGYIVNILAGSGVGKSAFVNSCITHWMTVCNKRVLVCSLEAEASEFGENLLSSVMQRKIAMIEDRDEKIAFVSSDEARKAATELFLFPNGTPRLYLLDDRGDFSMLQEKIEECVTMHDIEVVVIDVISDVFAGASLEDVDRWMKWEKNLVKATNCILVQVAHTKKPAGANKAASVGGTVNEEMLIGSGTQFRSAGINIALQRDKSHADEIMRNTTEVFLLKSRATGITGKAVELYYDNGTATLYDKETWFEENPAEF